MAYHLCPVREYYRAMRRATRTIWRTNQSPSGAARFLPTKLSIYRNIENIQALMAILENIQGPRPVVGAFGFGVLTVGGEKHFGGDATRPCITPFGCRCWLR